MIDEIKEKNWMGSSSPRVRRNSTCSRSAPWRSAPGLNPYQYVHVNLREQCSWVHKGDTPGATAKGINLVRAGVAKCALTSP